MRSSPVLSYKRFSDVEIFQNVDLTKYDEMKCFGGEIKSFWGGLTVPEVLDCSAVDKVCFVEADLTRLKKIVLHEGAKVSFSSISHYPKQLDLSLASQIALDRLDLSPLEHWTYHP